MVIEAGIIVQKVKLILFFCQVQLQQAKSIRFRETVQTSELNVIERRKKKSNERQELNNTLCL